MRALFALLGALMALSAVAQTSYEIGEAMEGEAFWKSDPVVFVRRQADAGFQFTSDDRSGADSRLEGGVTYYGIPVYESRLAFGGAGGISRVELMLFATAGTERLQKVSGSDGSEFVRRVRVEKTVSREEFGAILDKVRGKLTAKGTKSPPVERNRVAKTSEHSYSQVWPKTSLPTQTTLSWNYLQDGKDVSTFAASLVRIVVNGPQRLSSGRQVGSATRDVPAVRKKRIAENVLRDPRGDVYVTGIPMVDQGQKGYCAVATAERVLRYYGVEIDEHEIALAAGTSAEDGTSTLAMKRSVERIGRRCQLGTVVCYGDFEKSVEERIANLGNEVKAYNKQAKKMKREPIADSDYIRREGGTIYYDPAAVDARMDVEVLKEMKVNGPQKSEYTAFLRNVREQVAKGIPLYWGVTLGVYPEPGLMQANGGHMRLIVGYNDVKKEILYSDSWGAGHELKRMPADWAWTISRCLLYQKPH